MDKKYHQRFFVYFQRVVMSTIIFTGFYCGFFQHTFAQSKTIEGQTFTKYKPGYFNPRRSINYALYVAPVFTVDPLGLGGRSTYALSVGSRFTLWESKTDHKALQGLQINGLYTAVGYEYFPLQYDNAYVSLWTRVRTFMPIVARIDGLYSFGYDRRGIATRFCFGFEVKKFTFLMTGTVYSYHSERLFREPHPVYASPYTNAGSLMLLIPLYTHQNK
jgi:hypothetical protein